MAFEQEAVADPPKSVRKREKKSSEEIRFNAAFGVRLATARNQRGKTQTRLAEELRIGKFQYLRYETGETTFPAYLLLSLAGLLDKTVMWLLTGRD